MLALFAETAETQPAQTSIQTAEAIITVPEISSQRKPGHGRYFAVGVGFTEGGTLSARNFQEFEFMMNNPQGKCIPFTSFMGSAQMGKRWGQNKWFCNLELQGIFTTAIENRGGMVGVNFDFGYNFTPTTSLYIGLPCCSLMCSTKTLPLPYMWGGRLTSYGFGTNLMRIGIETEMNKKLRVFIEGHAMIDFTMRTTEPLFVRGTHSFGATIGLKYFPGMN